MVFCNKIFFVHRFSRGNMFLAVILVISIMLFSVSSCEKYPRNTIEKNNREKEKELIDSTGNATDSGVILQPLIDTTIIDLLF